MHCHTRPPCVCANVTRLARATPGMWRWRGVSGRPQSDFIGKDALVAARERRRGGGVASGDTARHTPKRIVTLELEEQCRDVMPLGNEAITIDGVAVGRVTSAAYGFSVGAPVCLG